MKLDQEVLYIAAELGRKAAVAKKAELEGGPDKYEVRNATIDGQVYGPSQGRMKDLCGFAYCYIRPQPGLSRRVKAIKEMIARGELGHDSYRGALVLRIPSIYQEISVNEAGAEAAAYYLNKQGISAYVESRLD